MIGAAARRLIGGLFDLAELGPLALKGFRAPVQAYAVRGEARVASRFDAARGHRLTPLIGRGASSAGCGAAGPRPAMVGARPSS